MELAEIIRRGGGVKRLADTIGVHHATIIGWKQVPPHRARDVSTATGIPLHELRPDLWDAPGSTPQEAA